MSTDVIQIYVPLLNEGTDVVRPTSGILLAPDIIRVEPTEDYDPELEEWQFPPGSDVRCVRELRGDTEILVARERAQADELAPGDPRPRDGSHAEPAGWESDYGETR